MLFVNCVNHLMGKNPKAIFEINVNNEKYSFNASVDPQVKVIRS